MKREEKMGGFRTKCRFGFSKALWSKCVPDQSTFIKIVAIDLLDAIRMLLRNADAVFNHQVC